MQPTCDVHHLADGTQPHARGRWRGSGGGRGSSGRFSPLLPISDTTTPTSITHTVGNGEEPYCLGVRGSGRTLGGAVVAGPRRGVGGAPVPLLLRLHTRAWREAAVRRILVVGEPVELRRRRRRRRRIVLTPRCQRKLRAGWRRRAQAFAGEGYPQDSLQQFAVHNNKNFREGFR